MIASTQITKPEIFTFIALLVFELLSRKVLFIDKKDSRNCQKVGYFLRKQQITGKLLQNYKQLGREIFRILLEHVSDHLPVLFHLDDCTFNLGRVVSTAQIFPIFFLLFFIFRKRFQIWEYGVLKAKNFNQKFQINIIEMMSLVLIYLSDKINELRQNSTFILP